MATTNIGLQQRRISSHDIQKARPSLRLRADLVYSTVDNRHYMDNRSSKNSILRRTGDFIDTIQASLEVGERYVDAVDKVEQMFSAMRIIEGARKIIESRPDYVENTRPEGGRRNDYFIG